MDGAQVRTVRRRPVCRCRRLYVGGAGANTGVAGCSLQRSSPAPDRCVTWAYRVASAGSVRARRLTACLSGAAEPRSRSSPAVKAIYIRGAACTLHLNATLHWSSCCGLRVPGHWADVVSAALMDAWHCKSRRRQGKLCRSSMKKTRARDGHAARRPSKAVRTARQCRRHPAGSGLVGCHCPVALRLTFCNPAARPLPGQG